MTQLTAISCSAKEEWCGIRVNDVNKTCICFIQACLSMASFKLWPGRIETWFREKAQLTLPCHLFHYFFTLNFTTRDLPMPGDYLSYHASQALAKAFAYLGFRVRRRVRIFKFLSNRLSVNYEIFNFYGRNFIKYDVVQKTESHS